MEWRNATRPVARVLRRAARAQENLAKKLDTRSDAEKRALARAGIGGLWDEMGQAQIDFLIKQGLKPTDQMLDVGCGALRGGLHFIRHLDAGNYYGIDRSAGILEYARLELEDAGLVDKRPNLLCNSAFEFSKFGTEFDVALAQSVFSHIGLNHIHRCLVRMSEVLKVGGVFYATFLETRNDPNDLEPVVFPQPDGPDTIAHSDKDPFRYNIRFFEDLVQGLPLKLEYVGDWGSLRGQSMLAFHRA
jgi:ubiquinone/menaquinone biosynthesis C-methylase UbiE